LIGHFIRGKTGALKRGGGNDGSEISNEKAAWWDLRKSRRLRNGGSIHI
jgi:hypothetical protein